MSLPRKEYEKQLNSHTKSAHALLDQMNLVHKTLEAQQNDNQFDCNFYYFIVFQKYLFIINLFVFA